MFQTRNNIVKYICTVYSIKFILKNKFFNLLKNNVGKKSPASQSIHDVHFTEPLIIKSLIVPNQNKTPGYNSRGWKYATIKISWIFGPDAELTEIYMDNKCFVTFINKNYFQKKSYLPKSKKLFSFIPIRGIGNKILRTKKYAVVKIYVDGTINGQQAINSNSMEIYFVNDFKTNLLINSDTFKFQRVIIDYGEKNPFSIFVKASLFLPIFTPAFFLCETQDQNQIIYNYPVMSLCYRCVGRIQRERPTDKPSKR